MNDDHLGLGSIGDGAGMPIDVAAQNNDASFYLAVIESI